MAGSAVDNLKALTKITNLELNQAKAKLLNQIYAALDRAEDRIEESAKNVYIYKFVYTYE